MGTVKQILIGLVSVAFLIGVVPMGTPLGSVAQAAPGNQAKQFVVLGTGEVLDLTTGLRWQPAPGTTETGGGSFCNGPRQCGPWQQNVDYCAALGDGYRLPELKELISLLDYGVASPGPTLPADHPFIEVQSTFYWSATTSADNPANAWGVSFSNGDVGIGNKLSNDWFAWCARSRS